MNWLQQRLMATVRTSTPAGDQAPAELVASWPAEWREHDQEREAILKTDCGISQPEAESVAALSVIRQQHPQGALRAEWLHEVDVMRRGNDPDWREWSPACRAGWARSMIGLARTCGFYDIAPSDGRAWLEKVMEEAQ